MVLLKIYVMISATPIPQLLERLFLTNAIEEEIEYSAVKKKYEIECIRKIKKVHTNITFSSN